MLSGGHPVPVGRCLLFSIGVSVSVIWASFYYLTGPSVKYRGLLLSDKGLILLCRAGPLLFCRAGPPVKLRASYSVIMVSFTVGRGSCSCRAVPPVKYWGPLPVPSNEGFLFLSDGNLLLNIGPPAPVALGPPVKYWGLIFSDKDLLLLSDEASCQVSGPPAQL